MAEKFLMPKLSPTMEEGQISRWVKNEGDTFEANETLAEVDTDKATMEMTALSGGTLLKILKGSGETAALGEAIAITGNAGEDISALLSEVSGNGGGKAEPAKPEAQSGASGEKTAQPAPNDNEPIQPRTVPAPGSNGGGAQTQPVTRTEAAPPSPQSNVGRMIVSPMSNFANAQIQQRTRFL